MEHTGDLNMELKNWFLIIRGEDKFGNIKSFLVEKQTDEHTFAEGDVIKLKDKNDQEISVTLGKEVTPTY